MYQCGLEINTLRSIIHMSHYYQEDHCCPSGYLFIPLNEEALDGGGGGGGGIGMALVCQSFCL